MVEVNREDWELWLLHPVTQALLLMFRNHRASLEQECLGLFRDSNVLDPQFQTKSAVSAGALEVYDYLLSMTEEDLNDSLDSELK